MKHTKHKYDYFIQNSTEDRTIKYDPKAIIQELRFICTTEVENNNTRSRSSEIEPEKIERKPGTKSFSSETTSLA